MFDQRDLTNTYSVDQAVYRLPLIGSVPARGHTLKHLEGMIAARLSRLPARSDVTIEVDRYRSIFLMGESARLANMPMCPA